MTQLSTECPKTIFPHAPAGNGDITAMKSEDIEIYTRFMRHMRHVPNSRTEIKVLSAIQFTADMLGYSDAHVAKTLVDLGLRGPRMAFPGAFLEYADAALMRSGWEVGGPSASLKELQDHWHVIGEDKFAAIKRTYAIFDTSRAIQAM